MIGWCIFSELLCIYLPLIPSLLFLPFFSVYLSLLPPSVLHFPWCQLFSLASSLISPCLNLLLWLSLRPCPLLHLSHCLSLPLSVAQPPPPPSPFYPTSLFHYLFISPSPRWTPDLKIVLATSEGRGQEFTGAWMSFSAVCLWSKALSNVKAHPSVIHNLLQSLEQNSQCGYSAWYPSHNTIKVRFVFLSPCLSWKIKKGSQSGKHTLFLACGCACLCTYSTVQ